MTPHNYCACPWCQGPKPLPRAEDRQAREARDEYMKLIAKLKDLPAQPYTSEWGTVLTNGTGAVRPTL